MSTCPSCQRDVVTAHLSAGQTIVLEIGPATYGAVEIGSLFPEDGCRVFRATTLVEHAVLCAGARRHQADQRKEGKKLYESTHTAKKGAA